MEFVRVQGQQTDRLPLSSVVRILEMARSIHFFELNDQYRWILNPDGTETMVTDRPTTFTTITSEGRTKRVENNLGAPEGLKQLEDLIDEVTRTKRWVFLDENTLRQLVRDGWSPDTEELRDLFHKALQYDELALIDGLIDAGADPNGSHYSTNTPPLMMIRSASAARLLLEKGANPGAKNDYGGTPLGWSAHLAPAVAELLLKAGGHADEPHDTDGRTPLWQAACIGNAGVVALLLNAGADPARKVEGRSAIDCTKAAKEANRLRKPLVSDGKPLFERDFDKVILLLEDALAKRRHR
jgi:hypothetical protein